MDLQKLGQKFNIKSEQEDYDVIHDTVEKGTTPKHDERIAKMTFASVYPPYVTKVELS